MNPALKPEDIDNLVMYERSSDRRNGVERRNSGQANNKNMRQAAEKREKAQPSTYYNFIGDFG